MLPSLPFFSLSLSLHLFEGKKLFLISPLPVLTFNQIPFSPLIPCHVIVFQEEGRGEMIGKTWRERKTCQGTQMRVSLSMMFRSGPLGATICPFSFNIVQPSLSPFIFMLSFFKLSPSSSFYISFPSSIQCAHHSFTLFFFLFLSPRFDSRSTNIHGLKIALSL